MFLKVILLINQIKLITTATSDYYGHETIFQFLTSNFCNTSQFFTNSQLIVIENTLKNNTILSLVKFLTTNNCSNFAHFTHLNSRITNNLFFQNKNNLQFIFNYVAYFKLTKLEFTVLLDDMATMQAQMCLKNCKPFICIFSHNNYTNLKLWINDQLIILLKHLKTILIFVKMSSNKKHLENKIFKVVHINPILNGCVRKQFFIPKTKRDFNRLKTPFLKCNFNNMTLNVSVNHVINISNI